MKMRIVRKPNRVVAMVMAIALWVVCYGGAPAAVMGMPETGAAPAIHAYIHGQHLRPLVEESGSDQTLNVYGPGGRVVVQLARDGDGGEQARYLLTDHLGSTRVVLDAGNTPVASFDYSPSGMTVATGAAAPDIRYRFTGHPANQGLETYHALHREYEPGLGRWLGVDPDREDASPYVYAANNPINALDRTGGNVSWGFYGGFSDAKAAAAFMRQQGLDVVPVGPGIRGMHRLDTLALQPIEGRSSFQNHLNRSLKAGVPRSEGSIHLVLGPEPVSIPDHLESSLGSLIRGQDRQLGIIRGLEDVVIIDHPNAANMTAKLRDHLQALTVDYSRYQTSKGTQHRFSGFKSVDVRIAQPAGTGQASSQQPTPSGISNPPPDPADVSQPGPSGITHIPPDPEGSGPPPAQRPRLATASDSSTQSSPAGSLTRSEDFDLGQFLLGEDTQRNLFKPVLD